MSRRYGRNQRRRAREEIARQQAEVARLGSIASERYRDMIKERTQRTMVEREMVDWAARIVALHGPESAFAREMMTEGVDAGLFEAVAINGGPYRVDVGDPIDRLGPTRQGALLDASRTILDLFALGTRLDRDDVAFRRRFLIQGPDGASAVVMDMATLHRLRAHGDPGLARYLLGALVKPYMDGSARQ